LKKKKKNNNQSTSYNIPVKYVFIGMFSLFTWSCSGWSIMGHALDEDYSPNVFQEIIDQDSVSHYYNATIYSGSMWCFRHQKYEEVFVK
tara:strand:- start:159 stop:425 length:267 start_codon:yes stop_codon:yes gene_type:complete